MQRPFADNRLLGPFFDLSKTSPKPPILAILFIPEDGKLLDKDKARRISEDVRTKLSNQIGQKVLRIEIWEEEKVNSAIGLPGNEGVYVSTEQKDKAFDKVTATSNTQIESIKEELLRTKGYGRMQDKWYVVAQGTSNR